MGTLLRFEAPICHDGAEANTFALMPPLVERGFRQARPTLAHRVIVLCAVIEDTRRVSGRSIDAAVTRAEDYGY